MVMSINTNEGALLALQTLNKTTMQLSTVQNRINTGLKVANAKDDGATFAIAQALRADVAGLNAAKNSLDRASSTLDVALAAGEAIGDMLLVMKEKAVAAADTGLDATSRAALKTDYDELTKQITSIVLTAEFNGINAVKNGGNSIVAITDSLGTSTITVAAQDMSLTGLSITVAAQDMSLTGLSITQSLDTQANAALAVSEVDAAISTLNTSTATLGSASRRFTISKEFVSKLSDAIEVGIGNLVDADMAKESANLQAIQVKQQLGLQALNIANQAPGAVMSLFR